MTWQTVLYFSSILLTCILTGFLAWYAWRQPHVMGARSYAHMVLAESLLALTEIGAMLVSTEPQAAFWFSLRVPFAAIIPVFWLFFALEYSGRGDWLSKLLRVALFAIPVITQVVMVTGSLHGLWVVQDVAFEKIGPFWIANTSARIPALWYLVHTFYSTLLLVVGAGALVVAAWRKPKRLLGQALLVSLGALTALGMALVGVFNLLPELRFNPFVPGIGFSAVCYALAIFRFQFLKRPPLPQSGSRLTDLKPEEKSSLAVLILIFILFVSGIAAASYLTYQNYERQFRAQVGSQLEAIASLKADELQNWRSGRLADANLFYRNKNFSERVQDYLENPQDADAQAKLLTWLEKITVFPGYSRVFLLDTRGVERLSLPAAPDPEAVPATLIEQAAECLASDQVIFLDFHHHTDAGPVHLSLLVPIFDAQDNQPLGVLILRIDPNVYLYPFIQRWPVPSESAETLLLRREGQEAVYLNSLHFQPDAALDLRFPLTETQVPAVKAALGETGVVDGLDYRGVEVIADIRPVPDSPWFLVSKIDAAEVYAPLRERLWQTLIFFGALILASGAGLMLVWRQQRVRIYRGQFEAAEVLRASEERFRLAFETSPDSVAITRAKDGMFVSVNKGFEQITGYKREEVIGKTSLEVNIWKDPEDRRKIVEGLQARGEVRDYEAPFLTREGEIIGLMSAVIIQLDGEPHILNITRDITEHKRAEEKLAASEVRYRRLFEAARDGILILDAETGIIMDANPFVVEMLSFPREEFVGKELWELGFFNDIAANKANFLELQQREYIRYEDLPLETADGRCINVEFISNVYRVNHHKVIQCNIRDITERKRAEEALRESESNLSSLIENTDGSIWAVDEQYRLIVGNKIFHHNVSAALGRRLEAGESVLLPNFPPDVNAEWQAHYDRVLQGEGYIFETKTHFDESPRTIEYHFSPIREADGKIRGVTVYGRDITERKRAEEALRESETFVKTVLNNLPVGVAVNSVEPTVAFNYMNENFAKFYRTTKEKLADPDTFWDAAYEEPDFRETMRKKILDDLASGDPERMVWVDIPITRKGEATTFITARNIPIPNQPLMISTVWDVTERKQAEERLRASEAKFKAVFNNAPVGISLLDPERKLMESNDMLEQIVHIDKEGLNAGAYRNRKYIREDGTEIPVSELASTRAIVERQIVSNVVNGIVMEDGEIIWTQVSAAPVGLSDPRIVVITQDITERKQAAQQLLTTLAELKRSNAELEQFAYIASHDLQEPLRAVAGMVQLLQQRYQGQLDGRADEYIHLAVDGATRMQSLINDLLAYSRVERRGNPIQPTETNEALKSALRNLQTSIHQHQASITHADLPTVNADATQLTQLFQNLIGNAIKFHGKHPPQIHVGVKDLGQEWQFSVRDNGIGIEPQYFERIFLVFQRLHTRRDYPGTGIGLSICKKIVERHGGRIWVESTPGQGTTFHFTIPHRS